MNFAPVTDVAKDKNSFIYDRTLGQDYETTAKYIPVAVKSIQSQKVASCLKHFPGYGDAGDTHTGFADAHFVQKVKERESRHAADIAAQAALGDIEDAREPLERQLFAGNKRVLKLSEEFAFQGKQGATRFIVCHSSECAADDDADGHVHHVAPGDEFFEFREKAGIFCH